VRYQVGTRCLIAPRRVGLAGPGNGVGVVESVGYVGTLEVETSNTSRLWLSLTQDADEGNWIKIGPVRAWFTMNLESSDRPYHYAQLALLLEAMRSGLQVKVVHGGAADFHHFADNDSFEVDGVRILRAPLRF
jgi:hypothetical protein